MKLFTRTLFTAMLFASAAGPALAQTAIEQAVIGETNQKTPEASTEDVRRALEGNSALVLDARKASEFVAGHIAGAKSLGLKPDASAIETIAAVEELLGGDRSRAAILYCNGPHCAASRKLADILHGAGFTRIKRYQLGLPVWRALSGPVEIEREGVARIFGVDKSAVFFDARSAEDFAKGSIPGAHNVPANKLPDSLKGAPLPGNDFNTRIILFGETGAQACVLADALGMTPFTNISYFTGTYAELAEALATR